MHDDIRAEATDWQDHALCAETDPEAFFPLKGQSTRSAKRICALCPVDGECLDFALDNEIDFGIWGGLSVQERRAVLRTRGAAA